MAIIWMYLGFITLYQGAHIFVATNSWEMLNGDLFWIGQEKLQWLIARNMCEEMGGYLATFKDQYTADSVALKVKADFWIDLNDMDTEGEFKTSEGENPNWTLWHWYNIFETEPNDYEAGVGSCGDCVVYKHKNGMFDKCCQSKFNFVCQRDLEISGETTQTSLAKTTSPDLQSTNQFVEFQESTAAPNNTILGLSTGVIVGIAVAISVVVAVVILLGILFVRRHQKHKQGSPKRHDEAHPIETKLDNTKSTNSNLPAYEDVDIGDILKNRVSSDVENGTIHLTSPAETSTCKNTNHELSDKVEHFRGPEGDYYTLPSKNQITQSDRRDLYSMAKDIYTDSSKVQGETDPGDDTEMVDNEHYEIQ